MCEGVVLGLRFKRESVRARYMGHVELHLIHGVGFHSRMASSGRECLFVA